MSVSFPSLEVERPRRGIFRRHRSNRRAVVQSRAPLVIVADGVAAVARRVFIVLRVVGKVAIAAGLVAGLLWSTRAAARHVIASPRFWVRDIQISATTRLHRDEVIALAGVQPGDRLLTIDTDRVAAQVAAHPWVAAARVGRRLPSVLHIEVTERHAAGLVALGGLYLVDDTGRPFKRATMDEAEGLPVITGIDRAQYVDMRDATEAALREALALGAAYGARPTRPVLSEIHIHPRYGFSLFLLEGGAEIRLGRGDYNKKLASLDQIFEAVSEGGSSDFRNVRIVHLDGGNRTRIPVGFAGAAVEAEPPRK